MLSRCGEQYRQRYILGNRSAPASAMLVGSGYHKGAEMNFEQKIESYVDLPASEIVDAAVAGFEERMGEDGIALSPEEQSSGLDATKAALQRQVIGLAKVHAEQQAPEYQPTEIEVRSRIVLKGATHDLLAVTDLRDDLGRVIDLKSAAQKPVADLAHKSLQLTIYGAAYAIDYGSPARGLALDTITKTKTPKRYVQWTTRGTEDFRALTCRINTALRIIAAGAFQPCTEDSWICSPTNCGYWRQCPYVNSQSTRREKGNDQASKR
jgi:hypothetical protein